MRPLVVALCLPLVSLSSASGEPPMRAEPPPALGVSRPSPARFTSPTASQPPVLADPQPLPDASRTSRTEPPPAAPPSEASAVVTGYPSRAVPVYSPYGYITNGYYKSGGVFVGADGSFPFDSGYYLMGGTQGMARVAGSYSLVVDPGAPGSQPSFTRPALWRSCRP